MQKLLRGVCLGYAALLTVLLLTPDPAGLLGWERVGPEPPDRGTHTTLFALLAVLFLASRFALSARKTAAILVVYALAVESLQYFAPPRTVELLDYAENLLGLACGTLVVAAWRRMRART
jgi:VanZ family protein